MFTDETGYTDVLAVQRFMDMFGGNPHLQRIFKDSLGLQFIPELHYADDDEDDYDPWQRHRRSSQAPLRHVVVNDIRDLTRLYSSSGPRPRNFSTSPHDLSNPSFVEVEAKGNDTEGKARLLQETKKSKERAEKKKKKKLKQKERKRQEKLEKEKRNSAKKETEGAEEEGSQPGGEEEEEGATGGKPIAAPENTHSSDSSEQESSDEDDDAKYDSCASEELDLKSSFVSKAAQIAQRKMDLKPKVEKRRAAEKEEHKTSPNRHNEGQEAKKQNSATPNNRPAEDYVKISTDLAVFGNKCANNGDFTMAVEYFTNAIKCNPTEFKLFGNRSFCFEKLQEYEKALADAELSLGICPGWIKGLFRKGRALAGLKRYDEAAQAFREVLQGESSCADAAQELMRVQITQLMEFGFTREQSSNALIIHGTVKKALEVLSKLNHGAGVVQNSTVPLVQVANVSGVSPVLSAITNSAPPTSPPLPPAAAAAAAAPPVAAAAPPTQEAPKKTLVKTPVGPAPNHPPELFPVWVGNLNHTISDSAITNLFNKAGTVYSVKVLSPRRCAFVNFTKRECCDEAIRRFHGYELNGLILAVRYPDRIPPGLNISRAAQRAHHH